MFAKGTKLGKENKNLIQLIDALTKYNIHPPHLRCFIEIVNEKENCMQVANQWMQVKPTSKP